MDGKDRKKNRGTKEEKGGKCCLLIRYPCFFLLLPLEFVVCGYSHDLPLWAVKMTIGLGGNIKKKVRSA